MTNITPDKLRMARDYAAWIAARDPHREDARAAAEIINALPETIVDGDELRELVESWGQRFTTSDAERLLRDLRGLLPTQTPRTLADMTEDEREACQWMQASLKDDDRSFVITEVKEQVSYVLTGSGLTFWRSNGAITPLPHLPRLEWPASEPVTEDTPEPEQPQPEDAKPDPRPGEAWLVDYEGKRYEAVYWYSPLYAHWAFVESREGLKTVESPEATPVSRLVSEVEA